MHWSFRSHLVYYFHLYSQLCQFCFNFILLYYEFALSLSLSYYLLLYSSELLELLLSDDYAAWSYYYYFYDLFDERYDSFPLSTLIY